jgi:DNA repair protein RadC
MKEVEDVPEGFSRDTISHPEDLVKNFSFIFDELPNEKFVVFALNSGNKVQAVDIVTSGLLNSSLCHPREVFRSAIVLNAASIIVAHNHPSGSTEPSQEDIQISKQLAEAGKIIGIPVHDSIIFCGKGNYTSLVQRGLI